MRPVVVVSTLVVMGVLQACGGGEGLPELIPGDPSDTFEQFDPNENDVGEDLPPGTDTEAPPDEALARMYAAITASGGAPVLVFDHSRDGQLFNVIVPIPETAIQNDPSSGIETAEVSVGSFSVRVSSEVPPIRTAAPKGGPAAPPTIYTSGLKLSSTTLLKSYSRAIVGGALANATLDFVSAFEVGQHSSGPVSSLDISTLPELMGEPQDCDALAWEIASEVPPLAVKFPPLDNCDAAECPIVKAAWIRAHHDIWRAKQVLDHMNSLHEEQRNFLWDKRAADFNNEEMGPETSWAWYFGGFRENRFDAIRWSVKRLWDDFHDHKLGGLNLDIECNPSSGADICNTAKPPAHHAVKSNIKICPGFWSQPEWYQPLLMVHEPLHHVLLPWKTDNNFPRLDPIQDTHTHWHKKSCLGSPQTNKGYGISALRHLATYNASNGRTCSHRNFAFRNNDTYGYIITTIGAGVRNGVIHHWPWKPAAGNPPSGTGPLDCDAQPPPNPGDGWDDPLNDCQKIGMQLVCPGGGGGAGGGFGAQDEIGIACMNN